MKITTEKLFSLSVFEGLKLLIEYHERYPTFEIPKLISLIEKTKSYGVDINLEDAAYLRDSAYFKDMESKDTQDKNKFYRLCIKYFLINQRPKWERAMHSGRKRFIENTKKNSKNNFGVFRAAGLADDIPSPAIVTWWDDINGHIYSAQKKDNMEQGRNAERLSLECEVKRLVKLGINKTPEWPGFEDNFAGFDILSYTPTSFGPTNRMIEVKSTSADPPIFHVTRHEWEQARKSKSSYFFHIWDMKKAPPKKHEKTVTEIERHIPSDHGKGKWQDIVIPLEAKPKKSRKSKTKH